MFYIPVASRAEAATLGQEAIKLKLAACANTFPAQSMFVWQGELQEEQEYILMLKTLPLLRAKLNAFITASHSYQTPAILSWQAEVNESYGTWMQQQLYENT